MALLRLNTSFAIIRVDDGTGQISKDLGVSFSALIHPDVVIFLTSTDCGMLVWLARCLT